MVREIVKRGKKYFTCVFCDMIYDYKRYAEDCESRCNKGKKCYGEMIKRSRGF